MGTNNSRTVEVLRSFDEAFGHLQTDAGDWQEQTICDVPSVQSLESSQQSQRIRIFADAQSYRYVDIHIGLYLEDPLLEASVNQDRVAEKSLIQQMILHIQIAAHHRYDPNSNFLLVTNSASTRSRVQAIRTFIHDDLKMQLDEWNISLYGGFQYPAEENQDQAVDVTAAYHGKSIIFLGEKFEFFGTSNRNIAGLCDARILAEASVRGTRCLFLGSSEDPQLRDLLKRLVFPLSRSMSEIAERMSRSQKFNSREDLFRSLMQSKSFSSLDLQVYAVPLNGRWYRLGRCNPVSEARRLAKYLQQRLPQERFLVAPSEDISVSEPEVDHPQIAEQKGLQKTLKPEQSKRARGGLAILHGASHGVSAMASEPIASTTYLPPFEALLLVQSLPISKRLDKIWKTSYSGDPETGPKMSEGATKCFLFSILLDIELEIQVFLNRATWPNCISFPKKADGALAFMDVHLPTLSKLLRHQHASYITRPPEQIIEILKYAETCSLPQKKRHIARALIVPLCQRRTELRKFLKSVIDTFLQRKSYNKDDIADFHRAAKSLHSYIDKERRETSKVLLKEISNFTKRTEHQHRRGRCTSSTAVPRTTYCTAQVWRDELQAIDAHSEQIAEESQTARDKLSRMILDAPDAGNGYWATELSI